MTIRDKFREQRRLQRITQPITSTLRGIALRTPRKSNPPNQRPTISEPTPQKRGPLSYAGGPGSGASFLLPLPLGLGRRAPPRLTVERMASYSPVALNDIKHLARSMPADGLEAQDVVPGHFRRGDRFLGKIHTLARFWAKYTRSRAPSLAALPVITWRLRLATVMAGLWSVVAEAAFEPV